MNAERAKAIEATAETYDVDGVLPIDGFTEVPRGTNLLLTGPPMIGTEEIALEFLARGTERGEYAVIVTPAVDAEQMLTEYRQQTRDTERVYVVDCSGTTGQSSFDDTAGVKYVSSPGELTGIGVGLVKCTREIGDAATEGVRYGVLSISTLLQYATTARVFSFLHAVLGRTSGANYLGVGTLNTDAHDDRTVSKIQSLFDGAIELRESDGKREARVVGLSDVPRTWTRL